MNETNTMLTAEVLGQQYLSHAEQILSSLQTKVGDRVEGFGDTGDNDFTYELAGESGEFSEAAKLIGQSDGVLGKPQNLQQINDSAMRIVEAIFNNSESVADVANGVLEALIGNAGGSYTEGYVQGQTERMSIEK